MSETQQTVEQVPAKAKRQRRSVSFAFVGPDNAGLRIILKLRKDGSGATTCAVHTTRDGKRKIHSRGATETWPTVAAAETQMEKLAVQATKLGWERKAPRVGFIRKPDAFTASSLPKPTAGKAKK
jgi:hypothetical protein